MNVWIVNHYAIPPSMGGLVRHYYFSKYLQQKGHKVKIFTSSKIHNTDINMIKGHSLYKEEMEDGVEYTFVRSRDYKGNGVDRILNMIDLPFKMWKTMNLFWKEQKPDVIYTSSPDLFVAFFALIFGKRHKVPVVLEIRDLWPESVVVYNIMSKWNPIIWVLYRLEKWMYMKADRIIFTMKGGRDYIKEKGWDKDIVLKKVFHVNNGVDVEEFEYNKEHYTLDNELLDDEDFFKILYTGSVRRANGLGRLIDVAKYIQEIGNTSIRFLIFGEGGERESLELYCRQNRVKNVFFMGRVDKKYIPYILSKGQVAFAHGIDSSLLRYGYSFNKLFEYIANEKPIVTDFISRYDLVNEEGVGISIENPTIKNVAEVFIKLQKDYPSIAVKTSENCRRAKREYDYRRLTEKIESILEFS